MRDASPRSGHTPGPPGSGHAPRGGGPGPARSRTWRRRNFALAGVALAAVFWLAETMLDAWVFRRGTFAENLLPREPNEAWMRTLTACLVIAIGLFAHLASNRVRRLQEQEAALEREVDDAQSRLLADFLPMCAKCKAIRDGDKWVRIEQYVTQHTGSRFSHGLCTECLKDFEAEFDGRVRLS